MYTEDTVQYHIGQFEGPLSLLLHLIEKNKVDITDIPIVEITEQYLAYLPQIQAEEREEVAAEFLVMASTLLAIKSRLLLPHVSFEGEEEDPRTELVLRLLEYRRCKHMAAELEQRRSHYATCLRREPLPPEAFGLKRETLEPPPVQPEKLWAACERLKERNLYRFQDIRRRVTHLLRQDKLPLRARIRMLWDRVRKARRLFFFEVIPAGAGPAERVSGFLALLELLRLDQIFVTQKKPFDPMLLEWNPDARESDLQDFLREGKEEGEYV